MTTSRDQFDELADVLRSADQTGLHVGIVLASALDQSRGERMSPTETIEWITEYTVLAISTRMRERKAASIAREYMSQYEAYLGALPNEVQASMRSDLENRLRHLLQK